MAPQECLLAVKLALNKLNRYFRINRLVMLSTVIVLMSASFAAIPWCDNFILMMALNVASSIFTGGLDVGE